MSETRMGLSAVPGQVRSVCRSTDFNWRGDLDKITDARVVCEDGFCSATASLCDSINDRFFSARICCSSFHFGQSFEDAAWSPLQLTQCSTLWHSASPCPVSVCTGLLSLGVWPAVSEFLTLITSQWIRDVDSDWDTEVSLRDMLRWLWCVETEDNRFGYPPFTAVSMTPRFRTNMQLIGWLTSTFVFVY